VRRAQGDSVWYFGSISLLLSLPSRQHFERFRKNLHLHLCYFCYRWRPPERALGLQLQRVNVTGFTVFEPTIAGKWLELLKEIAPRVNRAAFLFNPATTPYADIYLNPFKAAAASFAVQAIAAPVHNTSELEAVVAAQARTPNSGLIVMPDTFLNVHSAEITVLAARYRLPTVYAYRFFTELGGLLSYGNDLTDNFRRAATYADRILKGAKPSELPSRPRSSSSWRSISRPRRRLASTCLCISSSSPTR
jgi:ABC transporter substrate binding protein